MTKNEALAAYISYHEAVKLIRSQHWLPIDSGNVDISKSLGMISASTVSCGRSVPEFNRSAVDGFATRSGLTVEASERKPAKIGNISSETGEGNEFKPISTGEIMPEYADSVIMLEDTVSMGEDVFALKTVRPWENVSRSGEDLKPDSVIIHNGAKIEPENLAAALACRIDGIHVYRKFNLSELSTGDEILSGRIPNYTQPLILAYFSLPFVQTRNAGMVGDSGKMIRDQVHNALGSCDALIVTGGSGPGKHDFVTEILGSMGAMLFHGVRVKPGRTVSAFNVGGKLVLSVSGLPVAALVSGSAGIKVADFRNYSSVVDYMNPYGFYSRDAHAEASSIIESISAGKARVVSISGNDAVASAFREYLSESGADARQLHDRINYLPTRDACLSSVFMGESDVFLGKFRKSENSGLAFIHLGNIQYSILFSNETAGMQSIEKSVKETLEVIASLAVS